MGGGGGGGARAGGGPGWEQADSVAAVLGGPSSHVLSQSHLFYECILNQRCCFCSIFTPAD